MLICGVVPNDAESVDPPLINDPMPTNLDPKGEATVDLPPSVADPSTDKVPFTEISMSSHRLL